MPAQLLNWDSVHFGFPVARIRSASDDSIRFCERHEVRCAYFLVDVGDSAGIAWAERNRFSLVDLRTTLSAELPADSPMPSEIRAARAEDQPRLQAITAASFSDSRFFVDARFPRDRARALYHIWLDKCLSDQSGRVWVVEDATGPVGFIAVRERDQAGEIVLIGVDATSRGRGLGHRLVEAAASWFHSRSLGRATVVTQGRNRSALALYQGHGYRVSALELWYHRWF